MSKHERSVSLPAAVVRAAVAALVVAGAGSLVWGGLVVANLHTTPAVPWSVAVMAAFLVAYTAYAGGWGPPRRTSEERRQHLRARPVPLDVFGWAVLAGLLALPALAGLWIVLVELTGAGGNPTMAAIAGYPPLTVALGLAMGSLVSPITEEAAFRGYAQVVLERRLPGAAAVVGSSILFALYHGPTQGFFWSKLLFFFLVGAVFGTIALITRSTLPALPVHIAGDVLFFTLIWPFDGGRPLVGRDGPDVWFWVAAAGCVVFTSLSILAFRRLRRRVAEKEMSQTAPVAA